jgi:soluble lytic murein transglycosylase-like protein
MQDLPSASNPVDPEFAQWLKERSDGVSPLDLRPQEFNKYIANFDETTKLYLRLIYASRKSTGLDLVIKDTKSYVQALKQNADTNEAKITEHPMLAPLLFELVNASYEDTELMETASHILWNSDIKSCGQRRHVFRQLNAGISASNPNPENYLDLILKYKSVEFRREALNSLLKFLPDSKKEEMRQRLKTMAEKSPQFASENPWIYSVASIEPTSQVIPTKPSEDIARRGKCDEAKAEFLKSIGSLGKKEAETAMSSAEVIGSCYRRRGAAARIAFFEEIIPQMEQTFGFAGGGSAKLRVGILHWSDNDFDKARALMHEVHKNSIDQKLTELEARATIAIASLEENVGNADAAMKFYQAYVNKFEKEEGYEKALTSLALLEISAKQWKEATKLLENVISVQSELPLDLRSPVSVPFAMFWLGRIHLQTGEKEKAYELWRRLASEHYSTYYGALGHYMLERLQEKRLVLEPSRVTEFSRERIYKAFTGTHKIQQERVEMLLKFKFMDLASCEIGELDTTEKENEKIYVKSMYMSIAGDWLETVKMYANLPRSFRASLPSGSERLLFPKSYEDHITTYAKKLNLDPLMIVSLIRQESVFNPRASSPVGARGLMQLMPDTARLEVSHLSKNYLTPQMRAKVSKAARDRGLLYDPEINIILGTHHFDRLLKKYKSPVFALGSYNASPYAVERWQKNIPYDDMLMFIEKIPYKETQGYVKFIMRNYFYYHRWYAKSQIKLPYLEHLLGPVISVVQKEVPSAPQADATVAPKPSH